MLGFRIACLRKAAGLSQAELAQRININVSTLGSYETGRRQPSCEALAALSRETGVSIHYLLSGRHSTDKPSADRPPAMLRTGDGRVFNAADPEEILTPNEIIILLAALMEEQL